MHEFWKKNTRYAQPHKYTVLNTHTIAHTHHCCIHIYSDSSRYSLRYLTNRCNDEQFCNVLGNLFHSEGP